jgi:hypothetical protein
VSALRRTVDGMTNPWLLQQLVDDRQRELRRSMPVHFDRDRVGTKTRTPHIRQRSVQFGLFRRFSFRLHRKALS